MPLIVIGLVAVLAVGGGTSLAANQAMPGDLLYGVKVNVNENIEGAFALTGESRAKWNIRAADRRLEEAQTLASRGELDAEAQAELTQNFDAHIESVAGLIADFEARGEYKVAAEIASSLQAVLTTHGAALATINAETVADSKTQDNASLSLLVGKVQSTLTAATMITASASAKAASSSVEEAHGSGSSTTGGGTSGTTSGAASSSTTVGGSTSGSAGVGSGDTSVDSSVDAGVDISL